MQPPAILRCFGISGRDILVFQEVWSFKMPRRGRFKKTRPWVTIWRIYLVLLWCHWLQTGFKQTNKPIFKVWNPSPPAPLKRIEECWGANCWSSASMRELLKLSGGSELAWKLKIIINCKEEVIIRWHFINSFHGESLKLPIFCHHR